MRVPLDLTGPQYPRNAAGRVLFWEIREADGGGEPTS
jgi:hypothetical protein